MDPLLTKPGSKAPGRSWCLAACCCGWGLAAARWAALCQRQSELAACSRRLQPFPSAGSMIPSSALWSRDHLLMSASRWRLDPSWSSLSILPLYSVVNFPTLFKQFMLKIDKWRWAKKLKCRFITELVGLAVQIPVISLKKRIMGKKESIFLF